MFRRKEEGTDSNTDVAAISSNPVQATSGGANSNESVQASSNQPVQSTLSQQPSQNAHSQTPQMQPVVRAISDIARTPAANGAGNSYRPSPVAEFNRGVSTRPSQEAGRPVGQHSIASLNNTDKSSKSSPRILTVGNDILLKGEIATCDRVVIEGRVEAKLSEVHTVEIAGCGSFKGTAEVEDAEVSGLFEGDLAVRNRLVIYSTGEVRGNITYGEIEIERGGKLMGQIKTVATHGVSSSEKPTLLDVLDIKSRATKEAAEG